jgi:hypothetical protein
MGFVGVRDDGRPTGLSVSEIGRSLLMLPTSSGPIMLAPPEDRIYALIAKAIAASDSAEIEEVMVELRAALKEHIQQTKALAVSTLTVRPGGSKTNPLA